MSRRAGCWMGGLAGGGDGEWEEGREEGSGRGGSHAVFDYGMSNE